jgi:ubiquitin C-terminal hydrolase
MTVEQVNDSDNIQSSQGDELPLLAIGPPSDDLHSNYNDQQKQKKWQIVPVAAPIAANGANAAAAVNSNTFTPIHLQKRSQTGFAGLYNEGATCYLNSLLQSLYMTPELRHMVYQWRYNPEVHASPEYCIPLQLQRLFARLQLSEKKAVSTRDLTKSFGWDQSDSFVQHDVQELCRVLFDALDESFEQSENDSNQSANPIKYGRVSNLYKGIMIDYIQAVDKDPECINPLTGHPYSRVREDAYMDIQLVVKNMGTVEKSLEEYVKPELLTGDNKWSCDALNGKKVDAQKGLAFKSLPYLLTLQLNRFDYDYETWQRIKLDDRIEFPFVLDMNRFIDKENNKDNKQYNYELFAILIHSGNAAGGHYFAYIKNMQNGKWYNFNDSNVQEITENDVKVMYGGNEGDAGKSLYKSINASTNAYMLMYRLIDSDKNLHTVSDFLISEDIRAEIEKENEEFRNELQQRQREQEIVKIRIFLPKQKNDYSKLINMEIELNKNVRVLEAKKIIYDNISKNQEWSEHNVGIENMRVRHFDILKKSFGSIIREDENKRIEELGVKSYCSLTVQTKNADEEWSIEDEKVSVILSPLDPNKNEFETLITRSIRINQTLRELKKEISNIIGPEKYPADRLNIVTSSGHYVVNQYNQWDEDKLVGRDLGIKANDIIYIEVVENLENFNSLIVEKLHEQENIINVYFNKPETPLQFDQWVDIDKRSTISDLKNKISSLIGILPNEFRICNRISHIPIVDESTIISESKEICDYCQLYIEIGTPLKKNEYLIGVSLFEYNDSEAIEMEESSETHLSSETTNGHDVQAQGNIVGPQTEQEVTELNHAAVSKSQSNGEKTDIHEQTPEQIKSSKAAEASKVNDRMKRMLKLRKKQFHNLGKIIVNEQMTVKELKQLIYDQYLCEDVYEEFNPDLLRIRLKNYLSLGRILKNNDSTLKEQFPELNHGRNIVVQKLAKPEQFAPDDIIISVQRWLPSEWKFMHGFMKKFEVRVNKEQHKNAQVFKQTLYDTIKKDLFPETLDDTSFNVQEHLGIGKIPSGTDILADHEIALLNWHSLLDRKTKEPLQNVFGPPLCIVEDDVFIVRDLREKEKFNLEELRSKSSASSGEKGLTIKVYNKKREEEGKRRQEEEEKLKKQELIEGGLINKDLVSEGQQKDGTALTIENGEKPSKKLKTSGIPL